MEAGGDLDLAPIGNCAVSALIDRMGRYVWACAPRFDSDPVFSSLLGDQDPGEPTTLGLWSVDMIDVAEASQAYLRNTAVLRTELTDKNGAKLEILDFSPRYPQFGRIYRPAAFIRLIRPLEGAPNIRIRVTPTADWGRRTAEVTSGSNHIRFLCAELVMRLTTNCPVSHILTARTFRLEQDLALFLGPDEPVDADVLTTAERMLGETTGAWREWVRTLSVPLEWQTAVIRAAIALKLCAYEETGAIVAAMTTSIPEAPHSGRNWDYRYCWLRDAYYVVQALNRLGAADMLENYLRYLRNLIDQSKGGHIQPVYGVGLEPALGERIVEALPGFRGMGPVRAGNQAHEHLQHDVYGQIILSSAQAFFDERLLRPATVEDFRALEQVGERAFLLHDQPDAGLWEFRTRARGAHLFGGHVLGRLRPPGQRRRGARPGRTRDLLARARADHPLAHRGGGLERPEGSFRRQLRRRRAGREPVADGRRALHRPGRPAPQEDARRHRAGPEARPLPDALRRRRLRRAGDGVQRLHLLVHRSVAPLRTHGGGAGLVRADAEPPRRHPASCPRTSGSRTGGSGGTIRRPIRWSG